MNKSIIQSLPNYNKTVEPALEIIIPKPITDKSSLLTKRSSPIQFENTSFSPYKKNKILGLEEKSFKLDTSSQRINNIPDYVTSNRPQQPSRAFLDIQFMNTLNLQLRRRQEMQLICQNMLIRQALNSSAKSNFIKKVENLVNVKEEVEPTTSCDKEDASTTFPNDEKFSPVVSQSDVEIGKSDIGIHSPLNIQDETISVKEEFLTREISPVEEPALCCVTKLHPDWDLIRILDFYCRGKVIEEPKNRTLRSKLPRSSNEDQEDKGQEEEFISEDELGSLMRDLNQKLEEFLGFSNLDQEKVYKILDKNGMDIKKTMSLIKKNAKFYKKYFQAEDTS